MIIIAAGTFDHLHEGHKYFLEKAFHYGYVMIGLCADSMISHKVCAEKIYSYKKREKELKNYLTEIGYTHNDYTIKKINDRFGFADKIEDIDAILVTPPVRKNAEEINEARKAKNWKELEIVEIPLVEDEKGVISSTRIRQSPA